jgi:hypothetical protein
MNVSMSEAAQLEKNKTGGNPRKSAIFQVFYLEIEGEKPIIELYRPTPGREGKAASAVALLR